MFIHLISLTLSFIFIKILERSNSTYYMFMSKPLICLAFLLMHLGWLLVHRRHGRAKVMGLLHLFVPSLVLHLLGLIESVAILEHIWVCLSWRSYRALSIQLMTHNAWGTSSSSATSQALSWALWARSISQLITCMWEFVIIWIDLLSLRCLHHLFGRDRLHSSSSTWSLILFD